VIKITEMSTIDSLNTHGELLISRLKSGEKLTKDEHALFPKLKAIY